MNVKLKTNFRPPDQRVLSNVDQSCHIILASDWNP